jgi:alpha-amylase
MKKSILFFITFFLFITLNIRSQAPAQCEDVMLQAFNWDTYSESNWTTLTTKASEISNSFTLVWLPPSGDDNNVGMGYTPVEYFNQNNKFGNAADLKTLISTLKANGTKCIADIVVNHRSGNFNWGDFPNETYKGVTYIWGGETICKTDEIKNQAGQIVPTGAADTGEDFNGSRDIDHTNLNVRNTIKAYLDFMKNEMGYAGWRYDMTKGYSASYVAEYNDAAAGYYSVGEYFDGSYDLLKAWITGTGNKSTTFDFSFKYALNNWASSNDLTKLVWQYNGANQPAGLIHHPDTKRYATTFVDNHDTYRDANKFIGNVLQANAYMICSPGVPCISFVHWNANKTKIAEMIAARRAVRLHSESTVVVNQSAANLYVATVTGKNGTLIVKIGSGTYTAPTDYTPVTWGVNYTIWIKTITAPAPTLSVTPSGGTYLGGTSVTLTATNSASIYYTLDNITPTASSTKYSIPISITANNTVLKAIAIDGAGLSSKILTNTYITEAPGAIKVRFKAPESWTTVAIYIWENASTTLAGTWPGTTIATKDVDGFYTYTISNRTANSVGIVFSNRGTEQTVDLSTNADICWESGTASGTAPKKYAVTVVTCTTDIENVMDNSWKLYPNPTRDIVHFSIPDNANNIVVFSTLGKHIKVNISTLQQKAEIDLSACVPGIYYVSISTKDCRKLTKMVVKM